MIIYERKTKRIGLSFGKRTIDFWIQKEKKNTYTKSINGGVYGINLAETKVRGQEKMHIYVMLTLNFESLNNLILYLMNDYRCKGWEPIAINAVNLVHGDNPFGFYIEKNTNLELVVEQLIEAFEKYGLHIFDGIDTCEKLQTKLYEDTKSIINWLVYKKEWYFLALAIMLDNQSVDDIVKKNATVFSSINGTFAEFMDRINNKEKIMEIIK